MTDGLTGSLVLHSTAKRFNSRWEKMSRMTVCRNKPLVVTGHSANFGLDKGSSSPELFLFPFSDSPTLSPKTQEPRNGKNEERQAISWQLHVWWDELVSMSQEKYSFHNRSSHPIGLPVPWMFSYSLCSLWRHARQKHTFIITNEVVGREQNSISKRRTLGLLSLKEHFKSRWKRPGILSVYREGLLTCLSESSTNKGFIICFLFASRGFSSDGLSVLGLLENLSTNSPLRTSNQPNVLFDRQKRPPPFGFITGHSS